MMSGSNESLVEYTGELGRQSGGGGQSIQERLREEQGKAPETRMCFRNDKAVSVAGEGEGERERK